MRPTEPRYILIAIVSAAVISAGLDVFSQNNKENLRPIRMGITFKDLAVVDPADARIALEIWQRKLNDIIGNYDLEPENYFFEDMPSLINAMKTGKINAAAIPCVDYIISREKLAVVPILVPTRGEDVLETYILLVHRHSELTDLSGLESRNLIIEKGERGRITLLWLDTLLLKRGLPESRNFLRSVRMVDKVSQAVLPVFFRQADACIVTLDSWKTLCELNPQLKKQLHILEQSPGYLGAVFVIKKNLPLQKRERFVKTVLAAQAKPELKQILMLFRFNGMVKFKQSHLKTIEALVKENNALKSKRDQKKNKANQDAKSKKESTRNDHGGE
ncbi:MAG: PhnD/SsuA/transferrin family substrate-binding protein [Desulfobacteraceae bacterium]|nr:PhnD/SsuA/transferrin family substrate-binding protein [Desulfobacteraceae bacterium]